MTDGKGRERWERGKINQGETDAEEMSRRTCAKRSGSLARCFAESNRIFCHTTWIRRLRTVPYLNPVTYSTFHSLSLYFFYIISFPVLSSLHHCITFPTSHALILNSLLTSLVLSSSCPVPYPYYLSSSLPSPPNHVYKRSFNTKGGVLCDPHREGCWQGSRHYQSKTSKLLGL